MFRPALPFVMALVALSLCTEVCARASVANGPTPELPCPTTEEASGGQAAPATPVTSPAVETPAAKPSNKASRQRWKVLLPGTLKSVS